MNDDDSHLSNTLYFSSELLGRSRTCKTLIWFRSSVWSPSMTLVCNYFSFSLLNFSHFAYTAHFLCSIIVWSIFKFNYYVIFSPWISVTESVFWSYLLLNRCAVVPMEMLLYKPWAHFWPRVNWEVLRLRVTICCWGCGCSDILFFKYH